MTVLDTDFIVALLRGNTGASDTADRIEYPKTTAVNASELYYGARRSAKPEDSFSKVNSLLKSIDILGFDKMAALKSADIQAELMKSGKPVNILDVLIAGIVIVNSEEILTRNIDHFSRITGLKYQPW